MASVGGASAAESTPSPDRITRAAGAALRDTSSSVRAGADAPEGGAPGPRALGLPSRGRYAFLLELDASSTSRAQKAAPGAATSSAARAAGRTQLAAIRSAQSRVVAELPSRTPVLFRTHAVLAGVAVTSDVRNLDALRVIPGVKAVHPIAPKTRSNSYAVPLQGAPSVWTGGGGVAGNTGQGTSLGIVDTGIDYTHANFGGPGTVAAYDRASKNGASTPNPALFGPGNRVVGGTDLAGDGYDADNPDDDPTLLPAPDDNPLDCEGHGSHVAGSAGGSGVRANGRTYAGAYTDQTPFSSLRIGPGMAPQADLYAIRVFGCAGSTNLVTQAYDYAVDPDGDGDTSDHLDVVNLSLGSDFGTPYDADALAADAAAQAGVFSSISSGNSGDIYDVGGSPGTSARALTVAASVDAQSVVDTLDVTGTAAPKYAASRSVAYDWASKPDLQGTVVALSATDTACTAYSAADAAKITGKIVLVTWTEDALECGSVVRSANLAAAGAAGFVFANSNESFSAGITGSAVIPGVLLSKSGGDAIRAALAAGKTVTVTGTSAADFTQLFPEDNDTLTDFTSRGTRDAGAIKPDVTAVGGTVFSTLVGSGNLGEIESGTSMAAPMTAGLAALVRTANPAWSVEQVKADVVNTAGQDLFTGTSHSGARYAPNRVGTGRIEAAPAVANKVLAYVAGGSGAVGVSFGPVEVAAPTTLTKTVTVDNTGTAPATYRTSYDAITSVPGVSYTVSPATVTVPAGGTQTVTVTFTADPTAMTKTTDVTRATTNATYGLPVETLADASGHLLLTPSAGSTTQLRVAVYSAPRPASTMTQPATVGFAAGSSTTTLPLSGTGVLVGSGATRVRSAVAGLELQATSGVAPACTATLLDLCTTGENDRAADLKYVATGSDDAGVPADQRLTYFGIATQAPASTPATKAAFQVSVDADDNGSVDLVGVNTRLPDAADYTDIFVADWFDATTGELVDEQLLDGRDGATDLAVFDSDVTMLPISQAVLTSYGSRTNRRVSYGVQSFNASNGQYVDAVGAVSDDGTSVTGPSFDPVSPGIVVSSRAGIAPLFYEAAGDTVTITKNDASLAADKALGVLMLHFHNKVGEKAQVVTFAGTAPTTTPTTPPTTPPTTTPPTTPPTVPPTTPGLLDAQGKLRVTPRSGGRVKVVFTTVLAATGTVKLVVAGDKVTKTLSGGKAKVVVELSRRGSVTVRAVYSGDARYAADKVRTTYRR